MRIRLGTLMATSALVLLSACGGSADDPKPASGQGSESVKTEATQAAQDQPLTQENFVERMSTAQLDAKTAHMSMTTSAAGSEFVMEGVVGVAEDPLESTTQL